MVWTIYMVYTDQKLGYAQTRSMKQYMFLCPYSERGKWDTLHKLAIMAKYYNGSWEMKAGKAGYFIGKSSMGGSAVVQQVNLTDV